MRPPSGPHFCKARQSAVRSRRSPSSNGRRLKLKIAPIALIESLHQILLSSRYRVLTCGESFPPVPATSTQACALGGNSCAPNTICAGTPRRRKRHVTTAECCKHIAFFGRSEEHTSELQ